MDRITRLSLPALLLVLPLMACNSSGPGSGGKDVPGNSADHAPYDGIAPDEELNFTGTEPFWGGVLANGTLTYTTPGQPLGEKVAVSRFAGRNGIGLSGTMDGRAFDLTVTPGRCSDGMSDRVYPFTATLVLAGETREGCAWSSAHPFKGPKAP